MSEKEPVAAPITPSFTSSSTFGLGSQRRTSNFFPISGPGLGDFEVRPPSHPFDTTSASPATDPFPHTKRHNSSPLIGSFKGNASGKSVTPAQSSSRFFASGSHEQTPLTPYYSNQQHAVTTTPTPTLGASTPGYDSRVPLSSSSYNDISAFDLSNSLQSLNLLASPLQQMQGALLKPGSGGALLSMSSPSVSSSILNLGTSATTSGSATPSLTSTSIWNDNTTLSSTHGKANKLGTLEEFIGTDLSYELNNNTTNNNELDFSTPLAYSPILEKELGLDDDFDPGNYPDNGFILPESLDFNADENKKIPTNNIFSQKVNNPSFIPSGGLKPSPNMKEKAGPNTKLERMRDFLNNHKSSKSVNEEQTSPKSSIAIDSLADLHDRHRKLDIRGQSKARQPSVSDKPLDKGRIKVSLPQKTQPRKVDSERFSKDILASSRFATKYAEDYCSTFYKRNSHGYMFIREPTNSLKVNNTGGKSWVQLKIKLPSEGIRPEIDDFEQQSLSLRKLRVDIRKLPIWKPINLNSGPSYKGSGNNGSSGSLRKYSGGYQSGYNYRKQSTGGPPKETKKHKNLNVSKRFGKKSGARED